MTMKIFINMLLIFLIAFPAKAQDFGFPSGVIGENTKPEIILNGKVHNILISSFRNGNLLGDVILLNYDSKQRLIEEIGFNAGIELHSEKILANGYKTYYYYSNASKQPSHSISFPYDSESGTKTEYKYNDSRLRHELVYSGSNDLAIKIDFVYNDTEKVIIVLRKFYSSGREIIRKTRLEYNDKKQLTKRISYSDGGIISNEVIFEYDKVGYLKKETHCCEFNFYHTYEYVFDNQGNWIERKELYSQKVESGIWETTESLRTYRVITYYAKTN